MGLTQERRIGGLIGVDRSRRGAGRPAVVTAMERVGIRASSPVVEPTTATGCLGAAAANRSTPGAARPAHYYGGAHDHRAAGPA